MNNIHLTGRLVRDPETRSLENGSSVCMLRLAVDGMGRGGRDQTGYVNVVSFGKSGQAAGGTLSAGWLVGVSGRLQHETWQARDQSTRESYSVVGHVEFLAATTPRAPRRSRRGRAGRTTGPSVLAKAANGRPLNRAPTSPPATTPSNPAPSTHAHHHPGKHHGPDIGLRACRRCSDGGNAYPRCTLRIRCT